MGSLAAQQSFLGKQPAASSEGKPPDSSEALLAEGCSAAHPWPSQTPATGLSAMSTEGLVQRSPGQAAEEKGAAEQPIEVEELEWRPGQPSGSPPDPGGQRAAPAPSPGELGA